ncbi:hypothetical protein [Leptospira levettii]|uniref:hypothetical protein n=1 Tax=Leptospira levettii TaxID=2023178 RepID=UPI000C2A39F4|nr:hypothetical protein [Leptospira levettii]PJZ87933.1 hypothetical protein CH368_14320 [Leptospira levettii]
MRLVKSKNGFSIYGRDGGIIRAAAIFINPEQKPNLTGTVSAGSAGPPVAPSSTLTGSGTAFDTSLKVGEYLEFDLAQPIIAMVKAIASATSLTLGDPAEPGENLSVFIPAGTNYRKFDSFWLGKTSTAGISINTEEGVLETKSSDRGETPENVFSGSVKPMLKLNLMEASVEALSYVLKGMVNFTRDVNGKIVASSFGPRTGFDFKKNAMRVAIIEYDGDGGVSADPASRMDIFKVGFKGNINLTKNSSDQVGVDLEGYIFEDDTKVVNGKPQYWATNEAEMVYD